MIQSVVLTRVTHGELVDVAERLAAGDYGSAPNAVSVMARQSPLFLKTLELIKAERAADSE